jgi:hypothetical protein
MNPHLFPFLALLFSLSYAQAQPFVTPYEQSGRTHSATYAQALAYYEALAKAYPEVQVIEYGLSDVGKPLQLVVLSGSGEFDPEKVKAEGKRVLFINNAIHPGESCGVDACMMLARDLLKQPELKSLLEEVVLCIVPIYNVGGSLNRSCCTRANQVGPAEQGFRGNAQNLDLNRDFVKCDSKNALTFTRMFQTWLPDAFIDTHTTNGADYPAHLTYIPTLASKAPPALAAYLQKQMIPDLQAHMAEQEIPISPYVYSMGRTPDEGLMGFIDHPRYSSGYANLFSCLSFITEAHMLKSFEQRVTATYQFILGSLHHLHAHSAEIGELIAASRQQIARQAEHVLTWELDTSRQEQLLFDGYEARFETSKVTGLSIWHYDRSAPYQKEIPYFPHYRPIQKVKKPQAYLLPQAYDEVIERLQANGVKMQEISRDTVLTVEASYISSFKSRNRPYEGHFYHDEVKTRREQVEMRFYAGDKVIFTDQPANAYLVQVLEPEGHDSFFRWGFFDGILMQKEYFSSYLFEEEALRMLEADPELKAEFEAKKAAEPSFAQNGWRMLYFLYQRSPYFEPTYLRYPVGRWQGKRENLPIK